MKCCGAVLEEILNCCLKEKSKELTVRRTAIMNLSLMEKV